MQLFCDFDGTISIQDTTDAILEQFALPEWQEIEAEWKAGLIGSAECMQQQIALIRAEPERLNAALDHQRIDPTFAPFVRYCATLNTPLTVISDGVDYFIRRILSRYAIYDLPIIANCLTVAGHDHYTLSSPRNAACSAASGVCKCSHVAAADDMTIFIGDGRSDFCVANKLDMVFAKSALADYCEQHAIPYFAYRDFNDIRETMQKILPSSLPQRQDYPAIHFA